MRSLFLCSVLIGTFALAQQSAPPASKTQAIYQAQARSAQRKFDYIRENSLLAKPDQKPTILTEGEINAWLASGFAKLPQGVKKLQVHGEPGVINATAFVDFDEVTAGRYSGNPFLAMFRGTHEVEATAHAHAAGGIGQVHIDTISLDGVEIPRMALEYFIDKYLKPKHPEIGIDSTFHLAYRIDTATVGARQLAITQK